LLDGCIPAAPFTLGQVPDRLPQRGPALLPGRPSACRLPRL